MRYPSICSDEGNSRRNWIPNNTIHSYFQVANRVCEETGQSRRLAMFVKWFKMYTLKVSASSVRNKDLEEKEELLRLVV